MPTLMVAASLVGLGLLRGASGWILEAPRNRSVSPRPSWRFLAGGVPETSELCVTLVDWPTRRPGDGPSGASGCFASSHGGRAQGFVALSAEQWGVLGAGVFAFDVRVRGEARGETVHLDMRTALPSSVAVETAVDYAVTAAAYADLVRSSARACACADVGCERLAPGALTPSAEAWRANEWQHTWLFARLFRGVYGGTFAEAGAADLYSSVTDTFERYFCWTGIGVEPLERWATSNAWHRPFMLSVHGALCDGPPGKRAGFVDDGYYSGFADAAAEGQPASAVRAAPSSVNCHQPGPFFVGIGVTHIDLFVLDCEGCEKDVLSAFDFAAVEVDVWVVEGNHPADTRRQLEARYELIACIGERDMVFVRRGSAAQQRWRLFAGGAELGGPGPRDNMSARCPQLFLAE